MARISVRLADARSLKDKRMVLRRIKDRVRERVGVFVNEVGVSEIKDSWRQGELGVAVASGDRQKALALIDEVIRIAMAAGGAEITDVARDVITFSPDGSGPATGSVPPVGFDAAPAAIDDRTGSGDKALGGDDWVPAAWREETES